MVMRRARKCVMSSWSCVLRSLDPVQVRRLEKRPFSVQNLLQISKRAWSRRINYNKKSKLIEISEKKVKSPRKWHHFVKSVWILFSARKTYNFWSKMKKKRVSWSGDLFDFDDFRKNHEFLPKVEFFGWKWRQEFRFVPRKKVAKLRGEIDLLWEENASNQEL